MRIAGDVVLPSLVTDSAIAGIGDDIFKQNVIGSPDSGKTIEELEKVEKRMRLERLMKDIMEQRNQGGGPVRGV